MLAEDLVDELSTPHAVGHVHTELDCCGAHVFFVEFADVHTGEFLDGAVHGEALPRALEVDDVISTRHLSGTVQVQGDLFDHLLHEIHHPLVVLVGHIEFHLGELRIVETAHSLVAEVFGKFVYAIKSADDEAFEVQLVGNAQVQRHVQGVVMGLERTSRGSSI